MSSTSHASKTTRECVLLVYGYAGFALIMRPLSRYLALQGYEPVIYRYQTFFKPIEHHAQQLAKKLHTLNARPEINKVHILGHSMGAIVARQALSYNPPPKLGRFVMLAPPNRGSHVASYLAKVLGPLSPPLRQLSTTDASFVKRMPEPENIDIGIIAAARDRVVPAHSLKLNSQADFITLPCHHSPLLWYHATGLQVHHFLQQGSFLHS